MIPLKKIFPVIVVLITLSLLGIIYIQVNWIKYASVIKKERIDQDINSAVNEIVETILLRQGVPMRFKVNAVDNTGKGLGIDKSFELKGEYIPPPSNRFTPDEIQKLISSTLKKQGLDTTFEFAIAGPATFDGGVKMQSAGFGEMWIQAGKDSVNYKWKYAPLSSFDQISDRTETLIMLMPSSNDSLMLQLGKMIAGSVMFTIIIITAFALTIRTMLNQKKLSEIKSDFINNMTHELKTPLATISLAIDAIGNEKVMDNKEKIRYFSGIIKEENKRMNKQVESILQSALLEKEEIGLNLQATDAHHVIQNTVDNLQLQLVAKGGKVELHLDAINPVIKADDVHFSNLIFNLMDNAIKYSNENLEVKINTYNTRNSLFVTIADNGIGMNRDTVSRIFEKFYRAHTGNVHNVKGFGLGLAYVKAIVDAHKGKIKVESTLGKGSKFTLEFPQD